jgi:hypothetical protein
MSASIVGWTYVLSLDQPLSGLCYSLGWCSDSIIVVPKAWGPSFVQKRSQSERARTRSSLALFSLSLSRHMHSDHAYVKPVCGI